MSFFQGKKLILVGIIVVLLAAIPLTVYFLGQTQETRSQAQKATRLYFSTPGQTTSTASLQKAVGDSIPVDIVMDPGTNQVSFIKMSISYDPTKLSTEAGGIKQNEATFPSILEGPTYTEGNISITLSIGADPTKLVQTPSKIATLTLKALAVTDSTPTQVKFLDGETQVLSVATSDDPSENVLSNTTPIGIAIAAGANVTPVTSTTPSPSPTIIAAVPTTPEKPNVNPTCATLTLDRAPSGPAPFSASFTATGSDTDGTISKVTFNFGDGPVQDITQSGGIGTKNVSTQVTHTYNNPGTYQASALLTDNRGGISGNTCTQTITVTAKPASTGGGGGGGGGTNPPAATTVPVDPNGGLKPTMAPPGPGDTILQVGVVGTILSIIGALTFFTL